MIVLIALAGGLGAGLRFIVDGFVARSIRAPVPLGTLVVNVTGSFCLGLVVAWSADHPSYDDLATILGTGLLGGYTTFSAASVEAVHLARAGGRRAAAVATVHATAMLLLGLAAAGLGLWVG